MATQRISSIIHRWPRSKVHQDDLGTNIFKHPLSSLERGGARRVGGSRTHMLPTFLVVVRRRSSTDPHHSPVSSLSYVNVCLERERRTNGALLYFFWIRKSGSFRNRVSHAFLSHLCRSPLRRHRSHARRKKSMTGKTTAGEPVCCPRRGPRQGASTHSSVHPP